MRALVLNCTLKPSPDLSNTEALTEVVVSEFRDKGVEVEAIRVVDQNIPPGVETDLGDGDEWPPIHESLMGSDILVIATPTWLGQPSSVAKLVLERMDAMISEKKDDGTYAAYNKVAGVVVTGNEDGAHHVIGTAALVRARRTQRPRKGTSGRSPPAGPWRPTWSPPPRRCGRTRCRRWTEQRSRVGAGQVSPAVTSASRRRR